MIETPSAAFRQSSRDRRSPMAKSAFLPAGNRSSTSFKRGKRLDGRTKQRRLAKPYSISFSTTFEPIKPLDPVIRMRSSGEAIYSELIPPSRLQLLGSGGCSCNGVDCEPFV